MPGDLEPWNTSFEVSFGFVDTFNMGPLQCLSLVTTRKRSLVQGNVFTHVCHAVHRGPGGSLYDVTSCLTAWSNVPSGGALCLWSHLSSGGNVCPGGGLCPSGVSVQGDLCPMGLCLSVSFQGDPPYGEERAVRILLEALEFLMLQCWSFQWSGLSKRATRHRLWMTCTWVLRRRGTLWLFAVRKIATTGPSHCTTCWLEKSAVLPLWRDGPKEWPVSSLITKHALPCLMGTYLFAAR